jgi:hypothetical protein
MEAMAMTGSYERSFEDLPRLTVPHLDTAEQFVVGVFRCWDALQADPDPGLAWRELAPVFAYMGVLPALCAVDAAFHVVREYRLPALNFDEVDSPQLGVTEARFLCVLSSLQRGNARAARAILVGIVSRFGVRVLLPPLARIAAILDGNGHRLPAWRDGPPHDCRKTTRPHWLRAVLESASPPAPRAR